MSKVSTIGHGNASGFGGISEREGQDAELFFEALTGRSADSRRLPVRQRPGVELADEADLFFEELMTGRPTQSRWAHLRPTARGYLRNLESLWERGWDDLVGEAVAADTAAAVPPFSECREGQCRYPLVECYR